MASSVYIIPITIITQTPGANTSILNDITFASNEFVPGGAGLARVWFNADNNFAIKSDGLYRFDIPVMFGDIINIQSSVALTAIPLLRFEKILFGA